MHKVSVSCASLTAFPLVPVLLNDSHRVTQETFLHIFFCVLGISWDTCYKNVRSMFGSAITPHLTYPSGGSYCKEHGAKTLEPSHTHAAETTDRNLFQTTAVSLLPLSCLYTGSPEHRIMCIVPSPPIISDKAELIVHHLQPWERRWKDYKISMIMRFKYESFPAQ